MFCVAKSFDDDRREGAAHSVVENPNNSLIGRGSCRVSLPIFVVSFYLPFDLDFDNAAKEGSSECSFNRYASLDDSHTEFRSSTATLYTLTETCNNRLGVDMAQSSAVSNPSNHR
jgi:hypothetical protein